MKESMLVDVRLREISVKGMYGDLVILLLKYFMCYG